MKIDNRMLFFIMALALVGIFVILLMQERQETTGDVFRRNINEVVDKADRNLDKLDNRIKDAVDRK